VESGQARARSAVRDLRSAQLRRESLEKLPDVRLAVVERYGEADPGLVRWHRREHADAHVDSAITNGARHRERPLRRPALDEEDRGRVLADERNFETVRKGDRQADSGL